MLLACTSFPSPLPFDNDLQLALYNAVDDAQRVSLAPEVEGAWYVADLGHGVAA